MRKISKVTTATIMLTMLVSIIGSVHGAAAANTSLASAKITSIGGQDAQLLASQIAGLVGPAPSTSVLVISGYTSANQAQVMNALQQGTVIVTIGATIVATPTLQETIQGLGLQMDTANGALISSAVTQQPASQTISPVHLVTVVSNQGTVTHISFYALAVESAQQYQNILNSAAQEAASLSLQPSSSTLTSATTITPNDFTTNTNYVKQYEVSYKWVLTSSGDNLYTRYEFYELNAWDNTVYLEYWRTDGTIDHLLSNEYSCGTWQCGPYMNQRQVTISATPAKTYDIYAYGPVSTSKDTTVQVGINFEVSTSGGGVSGSYSTSWTNPGVSYATTADRVNEKMNWVESFNGPDYTWWPSVGSPTGSAYNSYQAQPSAVMRTSVGTGFQISTVDSKWETYNDQISCGFACFTINIARTVTDYDVPWSTINFASIFTAPYTPSTPSGPTSGLPGQTFTYTASTTDPDGDNAIWYQFSFSDGAVITVGPYSAGSVASVSHTWSNSGVYYVSVKAYDSANLWSGQSSSLQVFVGDFHLYICNFSLQTGASATCAFSVASFYNFAGAVAISISPASNSGTSVSPTSASVTLSPNAQVIVNISATAGSTTGTFWFTMTGTSGPITHSVQFDVYVYVPCTSGCGGGGGSIAYGSLITMADGSQLPVQNLKVGDHMLGYDPVTGQYTASVVNSITVVDTSNMLIIHTTAGTPFRVDANPRQTLWVKTNQGKVGWVSVTQIKSGDDLFTQNGWVRVTSIEFAPAGTHTMFDIVATTPYFADGYLDPIYKM